MEGHESNKDRSKGEVEGSANARNSRVEDDEDWESDKRKHKVSKSQKQIDAEEIEDQDSGRRKSSGDRYEARKRSGGLNRNDSGDEDDYDTKRELRSKIPRKSMDEGLERRSNESSWDRDLEGSRKRDDESEWDFSKKSSSKPSGGEGSHRKPRSKVESSYDVGHEKYQDKDSRYSERKDSNKYREADDEKKDEDDSYAERSGPRSGKCSNQNKHVPSRNQESDLRNESTDSKSRVTDTGVERSSRSGNRDWRENNERSRNRGRLELMNEDDVMAHAPSETRSDVVKDDKQKRVREQSPSPLEGMEQRRGDKPKQQRDSTYDGCDQMDNLEKSMSMDVDGCSWVCDRSVRDVRYNRWSRSPERIGKNYRDIDEHDRGFSDSDTERSISSNKGKGREKDVYREDRPSKGKDNIWNDKTGEREGSKDQWRRNQSRQNSKDADDFHNMKEWDNKRRDQGRLGSESIHSRHGYRKDVRLRSEAVRGSSFGNRNENSDSIEIRPNKNLDFGREDPVGAFPDRKPDMESQQEFHSGTNDGEWGYMHQEKGKPTYGSSDSFQEKHQGDVSHLDQISGRNFLDSQVVKGRLQKNEMDTAHTSTANNNSQSSFGNYQGSVPLNRSQQGPKGGRPVRGGRGRLTGRDSQRVGLPPPIIGPPFGLGLPPGQLQPIGPNMNLSPLPPIGPGGFIPPFSGALAWAGARGVDLNMLGAPSNLPLIPPPGPAGPRFQANVGPGPGHPMHFNQPGPGRGLPPGMLSPGSNAVGPIARENPADKVSGGWATPRISGPSGKAPSRGEQNDYSQNFVDTGMRPQNFIRELELTSIVEDYPKLRELIQRKDEIVEKSATPPMYYKCDLREFVLTPEFFGTKFDVILVDPPWEEYVHRAPGITDHLEYWKFEEIMNLKIEAIADTPSFIFLWVGDGVGLEQGRQCLKKWGFRRCEDICWVKTNKKNAAPGLRHDSHTLFQHSKEHCLMGIKGTVRRSTDGHIIHANIDTDIIIAEDPSDDSTKKPEDMYRIIEHFALGRRRLELFGEDHNIRSGWLTVGSGLSSSNFKSEAYIRNFSDKDGKVWQGGGGRNPPPDAPHLVMTTPEIENLRSKSPPAKNQQQQSTPLPIVTGTNIRRGSGNSPQNPMAASFSGMNIDPIGSQLATPAYWDSSPMVGFRGPDGGVSGPDVFEGYGYNSPFVQGMGDYTDFDSHRAPNLL